MAENVHSWPNLGPRFSNDSLHENLGAVRLIDCTACLHGKSQNTLNKNAHSMYGGDCDAAMIAKAAAAVTRVQSRGNEDYITKIM